MVKEDWISYAAGLVVTDNWISFRAGRVLRTRVVLPMRAVVRVNPTKDVRHVPVAGGDFGVGASTPEYMHGVEIKFSDGERLQIMACRTAEEAAEIAQAIAGRMHHNWEDFA